MMTAPTSESPTTTPDAGPADNDDALFAALTGADRSDAERFVADHLASDAPEAETPEAPEADADADEAQDGDDAPEAEADPAAPVAASEPNSTTTDPFAALVETAKPLTYKVNGQERTLDFIREVEGKGAIIPADKVAEVRNLIARSESNAEANRELYQFRQEVERLGGVPKFHEQAERTAMTDAASVLILEAVTKNPAQFVNPDGTPNRERIDFLIQQASVHAERARWDYRTQREQAQHQWREEESVEQVRETALPNAIAHAVQQFGLSEQDQQAALAHFAPFTDALLFKATPEQAAQWGVKPGTLMVDLPKMEPYFRDLAERKRTTTQVAEKKAQAAKHNAAVAQTAKAPVVKAQPPRNPQNGQFAKETPKKKMSVSEMKRRALAGKPIPGDDDYTDD